MRVYVCILILSLVFGGCSSDSRDLTEYELDEGSFGADTIAKIEKESGIDIVDGAKGLKFYHIPPIDPMIFAKIQIPVEKGEVIEKRLKDLTVFSFPKSFADDRCNWWPSSPKNVIFSKYTFNNGYYIEAYLIQEEQQLILYLKYFTI
ncbi:MAG: hypothetical protein GY714_28635 [Desulfobacterales bacterium]|nr:hypothetical protein [Desulfobacterales bacterium]MCP4163180.1 hypothetical protein [Deltaproteobacteria bacterium]